MQYRARTSDSASNKTWRWLHFKTRTGNLPRKHISLLSSHHICAGSASSHRCGRSGRCGHLLYYRRLWNGIPPQQVSIGTNAILVLQLEIWADGVEHHRNTIGNSIQYHHSECHHLPDSSNRRYLIPPFVVWSWIQSGSCPVCGRVRAVQRLMLKQHEWTCAPRRRNSLGWPVGKTRLGFYLSLVINH